MKLHDPLHAFNACGPAPAQVRRVRGEHLGCSVRLWARPAPDQPRSGLISASSAISKLLCPCPPPHHAAPGPHLTAALHAIWNLAKLDIGT